MGRLLRRSGGSLFTRIGPISRAKRYGLVSAWDFANGSNLGLDTFGTNNLTNNNTATQGSGPGSASALVCVAASSQSLSIASNATVTVAGVPYAIGCWFKTSTLTNGNTLISKGPISAGTEYVLYHWTDGHVYLDSQLSGVYKEVGTPGTVSTGAWHFAFAWYDPVANTINLKVDNGTINTTSVSGSVVSNASVFQIGGNAGGANYLNGSLAHAFLLKSPPAGIGALASEISTYLFNAGNGRSWPWL